MLAAIPIQCIEFTQSVCALNWSLYWFIEPADSNWRDLLYEPKLSLFKARLSKFNANLLLWLENASWNRMKVCSGLVFHVFVRLELVAGSAFKAPTSIKRALNKVDDKSIARHGPSEVNLMPALVEANGRVQAQIWRGRRLVQLNL